MSRIKELFRALRWEVFKIVILDCLLDSVIAFILLYIIVSFFNLPLVIAPVVALVFFIGYIVFKMSRLKLKDVEEKNPSIKEILRTANDNIEETNFVALALFEDLIHRVKNISSGSMVKHWRVLIKIVSIFAICFVMVLMASKNVNIDKIDLSPLKIGKYARATKAAQEIFGIEFNESTDIYGNSHIAKLGTEEVTLKINPSLNEVDLSKVKDVEEKEFEEGMFPFDITAVSDSPSEEKAPEEADLAIAYNVKIRELEG